MSGAEAEQLDTGVNGELKDVAGVLIPGGFGERGVEGKIRAAQFARIFNRPSTIARASRSTSSAIFGPAPGSPMSAVSMPSTSIRCRMSIF